MKQLFTIGLLTLLFSATACSRFGMGKSQEEKDMQAQQEQQAEMERQEDMSQPAEETEPMYDSDNVDQ